MFLQILDFLRIALVAASFYFGYDAGFEDVYNPEAQLHLMIPAVIFAVAGISSIEGLFFAENAAKIKGYEQGSNYQKQSAFAMLSITITSILIYFLNWGIKSELTILFAFLIFFSFSAANHAYDAIKRKNYKWQNMNRPFITLLLLAGFYYPVILALKRM